MPQNDYSEINNTRNKQTTNHMNHWKYKFVHLEDQIIKNKEELIRTRYYFKNESSVIVLISMITAIQEEINKFQISDMWDFLPQSKTTNYNMQLLWIKYQPENYQNKGVLSHYHITHTLLLHILLQHS